MLKSQVLQELKLRGFLKDCTHLDVLDDLLLKSKITLYCGFDLTAKSLHIGNLVSIMLLKHFQNHGHKVLVVLGGGTSKIGDPSGKDRERAIMGEEQILTNKIGVKASLMQFLDTAEFIDNADWLDKLSYIEVLNEIGRHFTLAKMLSLESIQLRLEREQSISFTEFNYNLLQSYDFYMLAREKNCVLQVGGSDQWGNITSGVDFVRKKLSKEVYGLTTELITTADGKKMGKSEKGALWVRAEMLDPFEYFQFFRNTDDKDVIKFLKLFTLIPLTEIQEIEQTLTNAKDINKAKEKLAFEATKICHGEELAYNCLEKARSFFGEKKSTEDLYGVQEGARLLDILRDLGFAESNTEAKNLIKQGSITLDDTKITDISFCFQNKGTYLLVVGKKKFCNIKVD